MSRSTIIRLLLAALVVTVMLNGAGPADTGRRNFEYFPDMARLARYNTFAPNPNFADGKTLQPPVPGTIPLDDPFPASNNRARALVPRPGADMPNPFSPADAAAVARGQMIFTTFCAPCHGATGAGDGPVTNHGYPAPPSLTNGSAVTMEDTALFRLVSRGTTEMPGYAAQIAPDDRWKAILFLGVLQQRANGSGGSK